MLELISLAAAISLTDWSESTFRRRFSDGTVTREPGSSGGKSMIHFRCIAAHLCIAFTTDDLSIVAKADAGDHNAQNEVGLMFLENGKPKSALYWFDAASKQGNADAMHWLGRCYLNGDAVTKDDNLGFMWLSRSAASGHVISMAQMQAVRDRLIGS